MTEKTRINIFMTLQWLFLGGFTVCIAITKPQYDIISAWIACGTLIASGVAVGIAALMAHRKINGSIYIKPSPEPREAVELVTQGIYSRIRHPIYLAVSLIVAGVAIFSAHWTAIGFAVVIIIFYTCKLRFEERLLIRKYPEYAAYRKDTGALLPRIPRHSS